jgi:hypothetical protein
VDGRYLHLDADHFLGRTLALRQRRSSQTCRRFHEFSALHGNIVIPR